MKKLILSSVLLAGMSCAGYAQQSSSDSLALLYRQIQESRQRILQMETQRKADSARIVDLQQNVEKQVGIFQNTVGAVDMRVREFDQRMKITDRDRYAIISRNLVNSVELFDMLNQRLNILEALNQIEGYQNILIDLNNPANDNLGFSYNKKVMSIMDQYIAANTGRDRSRIMDAAKLVLDNPVVQTLAGPVAAPIIGVSNSLMSFASSLFVSRRDVSADNVARFRDDLAKFTQYYARLNEVNQSFSTSLNAYQIQTGNLQNKLRDFVVQTVQTSGFKLPPDTERRSRSTGEFITNIFLTYNANTTRDYLRNLERQATEGGNINYAKLIKSGNLMEMNKRVGEVIFLYQEFESLYSQYISMLEKNNRVMILVLQEAMANRLSDDNNKVREQMDKLVKEKDTAIDAINKAINLPRMKAVVNQLDTFYPSL